MDFHFDPGGWLELAGHYPDLIALIVGSLVGYVFTVMVETYFIPVATDPAVARKYKGLTFILCWLVSGACSAIIWAFIDPVDSPAMRISISYMVAVLSFAGYPFIARIATIIWPKVGTAWGWRGDDNAGH